MQPGKYSITAYQGSTFSRSFTYAIDGAPVDLTGYTARMQVRENYESVSTIFNLTTENGGISIDGPNGVITVTIAASSTTNAEPGKFRYDLEIIDGGIVNRLLEGRFTIKPEVTV